MYSIFCAIIRAKQIARWKA